MERCIHHQAVAERATRSPMKIAVPLAAFEGVRLGLWVGSTVAAVSEAYNVRMEIAR
jgi:hypothetical protein